MIIQCINCNKKFEVISTLIPDKGRTIQCGSCNHTWFFIPNFETASKISINKDVNKKIQKPKITEKKEKFIDNKNYKNSNILSINNFLSYFVVGIISFIALIIILDTFKSPLSSIYPNLDLLLYSLFETIKDVILFTKDLLV